MTAQSAGEKKGERRQGKNRRVQTTTTAQSKKSQVAAWQDTINGEREHGRLANHNLKKKKKNRKRAS